MAVCWHEAKNQRQNQKWQIISKAIFTSLLKTCTGLNFSRDFPVPTDCPGAFEDAWCYASKSLKPTANKSLKKIQMLSNSLDVRHFFVESLCMYLRGQTAGRSET